MGMDEIKPGAERPDYEAAVVAVLALTPESDKPSVDKAIGNMVRAIVAAGLLLGQSGVIFAKLDEKAHSYAGGEITKSRSAVYIAREIREAVTALRNHANASRHKKRGPQRNINYLAKYYPKTPEEKF